MAFTHKELMAIGIRFNTERMTEQITVSLTTAKKYEAELGSKFPAAAAESLASLLTKIAELSKTQSEKKFEANTGNVPVVDLLDVVKEGIRDIIAAADNAYEEEPEIRAQFHKGGPLGKSVPGVIDKAKNLIVLARKNRTDLAAWGLADEEVDSADTSVTALSEAEGRQEKALTNLPPATAALYEAKGRAYLLLKKLRRAGKRSFPKNPPVAAEFELSILKRKKSPPKDAPEPPAN